MSNFSSTSSAVGEISCFEVAQSSVADDVKSVDIRQQGILLQSTFILASPAATMTANLG